MIPPVKANTVSNPQEAASAGEDRFGPWNPGVASRTPREWLGLATLFHPENAFGDLASVEELAGLTGLPRSELVAFRPQRLALHELLIRVTADFAVPDGSRIEDLGINFRRIASRILTGYLVPRMAAIETAFEDARGQVTATLVATLAEIVGGRGVPSWGLEQIAECQKRADAAAGGDTRTSLRALTRVLSGLFTTNGRAWGTRELILRLARDRAVNLLGSEVVGRTIEPFLREAALAEGYRLLPAQDAPIVINTKGASASGKSTLRPLQKQLAGDIGVRWSDFALISPDIWRKQLLDYGSLGRAYKYAGALTAEELQIVDRKLDVYMARKHSHGKMSHLLIDRFRFDSFAPDSDEEGSNLLTRFGQTAHLFFVITPPEQLVERAWKRGLEFGRYKAVDDTLAHAVEAYTGIPNVFFTWVRRSDKRIQFEFLDNTVALGERPRTVAFGDNETVNVLDVKGMLDIDRYGRVFVDALAPEQLYRHPQLLRAEHNVGFLKRCVDGFRRVNFAAQASGRIYLRMESGVAVWADPEALQAAVADADTRAGLTAVAPAAIRGEAGSGASTERGAGASPQYLRPYAASAPAADDPPRAADGSAGSADQRVLPTLGVWGTEKVPIPENRNVERRAPQGPGCADG
jgi:hypothetical protein